MALSFVEIFILIFSGIVVAFINTFAGGGSVISITLFMMLGMSPLQANVINRVPVFFQTIASSYLFWKKGLLDVSRGLTMGVPMIMGCLVGANILVTVNEQAFDIFLGLILLVILFFIFYKPEAWLKGNEKLQQKKMDWKSFVAFFVIGIYAGFLHVGVGYFLIVALVLLMGYDLLKGNAQKNFLVLLYSPFAIGFFIFSGDLTLKMASYGLIHAIGNVIGASLATHFGVKWGNNFIRWLIFVVVILTALKLFGVIGFPEFG
ncbi:MAG: sulfite exporter TauE/SafE family protein [Bacteroidales bacterium]|nr:sulfite exporter TauE/SafE family protein [Bacteroidales bacterium]